MKQLLTLFVLLIISVSYGQDSSRDFCSYKDQLSFPCWKSDKIEDQKKNWPNGNISTEYDFMQDSIRIRFEYYQSGNLKFTCEVYQVYSADTTFTIDPDTGEIVMNICNGYHDVPHGNYKELEDWHISAVKSEGQFTNGIMKGEWTLRDKEKGLIVANFNQEGMLDGDYSIYYWTGSYNREKLNIKGQYSVYDYHYSKIDRDTGEHLEYPTRKSHRSGRWVAYDFGGDTLQLIEYEWKRK